MSYDKMLYEAQKHWRKRQRQQRQLSLQKAERLAYEENKEEIILVKKAAFIAIFLERTDVRNIKVEVGDVLMNVKSTAELDYYFHWCCRRLD